MRTSSTPSTLWCREDIPAVITGQIPTSILQAHLPTNPVHVLDLAFFLPAILMTGVLLWRRNPWGYLLAGPLLIFSSLMGTAIFLIFVVMGRQGLPTDGGVAAIFALLVVVSLALCLRYLSAVGSSRRAG